MIARTWTYWQLEIAAQSLIDMQEIEREAIEDARADAERERRGGGYVPTSSGEYPVLRSRRDACATQSK